MQPLSQLFSRRGGRALWICQPINASGRCPPLPHPLSITVPLPITFSSSSSARSVVMLKLKSRTGCVPCRQRKKKCDERRPVCSTCSRLCLPCSYHSPTSASAPVLYSRTRTFALQLRTSGSPPLSQALSLTGLTFESEIDEAIFARVPRTAVLFYSPSSDAITRDEAEFRLLLVEDPLLRDTVIACFSVLLHAYGLNGTLHRAAFARALTLLRRRLGSASTDLKDIFGVQLAVNFIGLLEVCLTDPKLLL